MEILPDVVDSLPQEAVACVHSAYTFHHFPPEAQRRFLDEVLPAIGTRRDLVWLAVERFDEFPRLQLLTWLDGRRSGRVLARHHPVGAWIEWLDGPSAGWTDQGS